MELLIYTNPRTHGENYGEFTALEIFPLKNVDNVEKFKSLVEMTLLTEIPAYIAPKNSVDSIIKSFNVKVVVWGSVNTNKLLCPGGSLENIKTYGAIDAKNLINLEQTIKMLKERFENIFYDFEYNKNYY